MTMKQKATASNWVEGRYENFKKQVLVLINVFSKHGLTVVGASSLIAPNHNSTGRPVDLATAAQKLRYNHTSWGYF
jgi:hypothetical protein